MAGEIKIDGGKLPEPWPCPNCKIILRGHEQIAGESGKPEPGNISICFHCQVLTIFDEELKFRFPTNAEVKQMKKDKRFWGRMQKTRFILKILDYNKN